MYTELFLIIRQKDKEEDLEITECVFSYVTEEKMKIKVINLSFLDINVINGY